MVGKLLSKGAVWTILTAALLFGLGGFFLGKNHTPVESPGSVTEDALSEKADGQKLHISVTVDKAAGLTAVPVAEGDWDKITYLGISEATIAVDGANLKLDNAIREGRISVDQIVSRAKLDAKAGFCAELSESKNGLTRFTYRYPEYDLLYIYDVYETPDGEQNLISEFGICEPERTPSFLYMNDETGKPIDYEDWGLDFEISEIRSDGITLNCAHYGGQQLGDLYVRFYNLYKKDAETHAEEFMEPLIDEFRGESNLDILINREGETEIPVDFTHLHGELPAGDYVIYLMIDDVYNKEEVHPLMRNYYDNQFFGLPFTID